MASIQVVVHNADHLTTWVTVVGTVLGAIIVASIAAVTAQVRLNRRLESELERHREQLAFARGETDRAEVRKLIDELAEQLGLLEEAAEDAKGKVHALSSQDWDEPDDPVLHRTVHEARELLSARAEGMVLRLQALRLRLGDDSKELINLASRARRAAIVMSASLMIFDPATPELGRFDGLHDEVRRHVGGFMEAARLYTEARLVSIPTQAAQPSGSVAEACRPANTSLDYRADEAYLKTFVRRRRVRSQLRRTE